MKRNEDNFDLTDGDNYLYSYRSKASWTEEGIDKVKYHFILRSASTLSIARYQANINKKLSFFPKTVSTGITKISMWPHKKEKTMSGGEFGYIQNRIEETADQVDSIFITRSVSWNKLTMKYVEETSCALRKAAEMLRRLDGFVSGDDSEDTFNTRWEENLKALADVKNEISEIIY